VTSPNPGSGDNFLAAVAASSTSNLWAVGTFGDGGPGLALVTHCC
jgi:hypothetical protein